jgi:hypothetical protein
VVIIVFDVILYHFVLNNILVLHHVVYILIIFTLAIAFNYLSLPKKCICFNSHCLPWLLWFHLILLNLFCVILNVGRDDDSICVHFVFKCKIINNALILGDLSYILYNILLGIISIGIGYCWKTNLFFLVLSVTS